MNTINIYINNQNQTYVNTIFVVDYIVKHTHTHTNLKQKNTIEAMS